MYRTMSIQLMTRITAILLLAAGVTGCSLEGQAAPSLTGPSEFGLSVTLTATPDQLPRDGSSQSTVTVSVRDSNGRPVSGQRLGILTNAGSLSQNDIVTGANGTASFTFIAPTQAETVSGNVAIIQVLPVGGNFDNAVTRSVSIRLAGVANATVPVPSFTVTPSAPEVSQVVSFDASATTDEGGPCGTACTYSWNFDEGTVKSGRIVTHTFTAARTYTVTLTVTDAAGATASVQRLVTVSTVASPSVALTVAPNPPLAGQQATFKATATPAAGHSVVRYAWNFGDGTSQTTTSPSVTKTYATQGVYVVTVTVTDDLGQTGSISQQLTITNSAVNASIVFSPTDPLVGDEIHFTAANATAPEGATITKYEWNFGDHTLSDGGTAEGRSVQHAYSAARTYVVRLTITDSKGNVGTFRRDDVAVSEP